MTTKTSHPTINLSGLTRSPLQQVHQAERGMALVVTLFIVVLLTVLVLEYHFDAVIELDMAANYANDVRAHHLALAGMQFARALLQRDDAKSDGPEDPWYTLSLLPACIPPQQLLELAASTGTGTDTGPRSPSPFALESPESQSAQDTVGDVGCVVLRISDESGKLPINAMVQDNTNADPSAQPSGSPTSRQTPQRRQSRSQRPAAPANTTETEAWKSIFTNFFESFAINPEVVEALMDWIDADLEGEAEESYYSGLATPYKPPNGPMRRLGELRLVKGFDAETLAKLFPGLPPQAIADVDLSQNPYLTPYGEAKEVKVNLNTANSVVLHALIEGLEGSADCVETDILLARQQQQFVSIPAGLCGVQNLGTFAGVSSTHFRIEALGQVGAIKKKVVAVIKRNSGTTGGTQSSTAMEYFKIE